MGTTLGTKLAKNTPKSWYFPALIKPNLRELQALCATHNLRVKNPKVGFSVPP
jgi:fructose-1-phosphate kinase PfkB-like protein